jgi:hypothetical protein
MSTPLAAPLPAGWTVREARDAYLRENGFTLDAYDAPRVSLSLFRLTVVVPNPPARRVAVRFHDLHHVVTGYGTDLAGEAEISAWEMRRGFRGLGLYPRLLVGSAVLLGLFVAPRRMLRAFRACPGGRSLFSDMHDYDALLDLTVGELRTRLGVPEVGVAPGPRRLHPLAPRANASASV